MPFLSDKQRGFLFANKPKVARKLSQHNTGHGSDHGPATPRRFRLRRKKKNMALTN